MNMIHNINYKIKCVHYYTLMNNKDIINPLLLKAFENFLDSPDDSTKTTHLRPVKTTAKECDDPKFLAIKKALAPLGINLVKLGESSLKAEDIRKALEKNNMATICTIEDPIEYRILPEIDIIATIQINDTNSINNKILELFQNIDIDVYVKDDETFFMQRVSNSTQFFFSSKNLNFSEDDLFISQVKNKMIANGIDIENIDFKNNILEALKTLICITY